MSKNDNKTSGDDVATKDDVRAIVTEAIDNAIDNFAIIVGRGFADTQAQINALQGEFHEFRSEMTEFKSNMLEFKGNTEPALYTIQIDVAYLKNEMRDVKSRLDRIEWNHAIFT